MAPKNLLELFPGTTVIDSYNKGEEWEEDVGRKRQQRGKIACRVNRKAGFVSRLEDSGAMVKRQVIDIWNGTPSLGLCVVYLNLSLIPGISHYHLEDLVPRVKDDPLRGLIFWCWNRLPSHTTGECYSIPFMVPNVVMLRYFSAKQFLSPFGTRGIGCTSKLLTVLIWRGGDEYQWMPSYYVSLHK